MSPSPTASGPTTDDASRYVDAGEREEWRDRDPIDRVQRYLASRGRWDDDIATVVADEIDQEISDALTQARAARPTSSDDLFDHVFDSDTPRLAEQRATWSEGG